MFCEEALLIKKAMVLFCLVIEIAVVVFRHITAEAVSH
jgi:hypothetical protein